MPRSDNEDVERKLQVNALQMSRNLERRHRTRSLRSFYATDDSDSDNSIVSVVSRAVSQADYPTDGKGKHRVPDTLRASEGNLSKSFRKKVKKIAKREKRLNTSADSEVIEIGRGTPSGRTRAERDLSKLVEDILDEPHVDIGVSIAKREHQLKSARMTLFAVRTAIDVQPNLLEKTRRQLKEIEKKALGDNSPGVYSMHASMVLNKLRNDDRRSPVSAPINDAQMREMVARSRCDTALTQHLLYSQRYDAKWKQGYTDLFLADSGKREKKPENRQGWVLPLKRLCDKVGVASRFFTDNRYVTLSEARAQVLYERLSTPLESSDWLYTTNPSAVSNKELELYMKTLFEPRVMKDRLAFYIDHIKADRDRVRVVGKYYNNIQLGKRMFGPSKKQKFESSIMGGMERRFEILDNQVNHIPFTHEASDDHQDKCRNTNVRCRDSTRVVLSYPDDGSVEHDFIHANWVRGGPLFGQFIITQAPLPDTIGDFWRMIWQERVPYILMLMSRKQPDRCAHYWPRKSAPLIVHGLTIENCGVDESRDPLFVVTMLKITGPFKEEHYVEHWQGDMNNSCNLMAPLRILQLVRNCSRPVVVHDCLGISRAACLVATEIAICSLIKGPTYKHLVQKSIQFLRSQRPFSIETPMQYIYIHRCLLHFFKDFGASVRGFNDDYKKWLAERGQRMFLDNFDASIPGYLLLSPRVDPDLLRQVARPSRPNYRREAPDCVGEWPLPLEESTIISPARRTLAYED